jgi:thymidine phosphorylase
LKGEKTDNRLLEVTYALGESILCNSNLVANKAEARSIMERVLSNGKAAEKFAKMVSALGGPKDLTEKPEKHLRKATISGDIFAEETGYINYINTRQLGNTLITLGGGRRRVEDKIDHSVGMKFLVELGSSVEKDQPIAKLHASSETLFESSYQQIIQSIRIESSNKLGRIDPIIEYFE